jgi:hypothetical protein
MNPNLTETPLYHSPESFGKRRVVGYLGAVHNDLDNRRAYLYREMTEDESDPYWLVIVTHSKGRKRPTAEWFPMSPDRKCDCCDKPLLDQLSFDDSADHPCVGWLRWDYVKKGWICPCCWNKQN